MGTVEIATKELKELRTLSRRSAAMCREPAAALSMFARVGISRVLRLVFQTQPRSFRICAHLWLKTNA
jgi:hypothetical protein